MRKRSFVVFSVSWAFICLNCDGGNAASNLSSSDGGGGQGETGATLRLIAPLSTASVTSRRPTLKWQLPLDGDGAHVQICRDRACTTEVTSFDAAGVRGRSEIT